MHAAWSEEHRNFAVRFDSAASNEFHFLHSKSVDEMGLAAPDANDDRLSPGI